MCFIERETWNLNSSNFRGRTFPEEKQVLRAHGMKSDEKLSDGGIVKIYAGLFEPPVPLLVHDPVIDRYFTLISYLSKHFSLNPRHILERETIFCCWELIIAIDD